MKFGKWLKQQIRESFPEWRDEFLAYKDLKRSVKLISATPPELAMATRVEAYFIRLLYSEIDKFNAFFSEHEENFVIRQKELRERITTFQMGPTNDAWSEVEYREEMQEIRRDVVNLHGEMVLLVNYSCVNYTGFSSLAKILKKYDKRTGRLLRLPFIKKVLEQPFFTTDIISNLVKECENTMDMVFPVSNEEWLATVGQGTAPLIIAEESIFRNTVAALVTMREMRRASSTNSPLSLPPLNLPENDLIHLVQLRSPMNNTI